MSFNDVLQTTGRRDDDLRTCAEVELLLLDGTLLTMRSAHAKLIVIYA